MDLYGKIQELCDQKGLSIYKLEQETGLSKGSIRKWESSSPSSDKLMMVSKYLGVSMESLLDEKSYRDSVPYMLIQKLIEATEKRALVWKPMADYVDHEDHETFYRHPFNNLNDNFDIYFGKSVLPEDVMYDRNGVYYAQYKKGGYMVAVFERPNSDYRLTALFVFNNSQFSLYATDQTMPAVEKLYIEVQSAVAGTDDLVDEFLFDSFNGKLKVSAAHCIICGKKLKIGEKDMCSDCLISDDDKKQILSSDVVDNSEN